MKIFFQEKMKKNFFFPENENVVTNHSGRFTTPNTHTHVEPIFFRSKFNSVSSTQKCFFFNGKKDRELNMKTTTTTVNWTMTSLLTQWNDEKKKIEIVYRKNIIIIIIIFNREKNEFQEYRGHSTWMIIIIIITELVIYWIESKWMVIADGQQQHCDYVNNGGGGHHPYTFFFIILFCLAFRELNLIYLFLLENLMDVIIILLIRMVIWDSKSTKFSFWFDFRFRLIVHFGLSMVFGVMCILHIHQTEKKEIFFCLFGWNKFVFLQFHFSWAEFSSGKKGSFWSIFNRCVEGIFLKCKSQNRKTKLFHFENWKSEKILCVCIDHICRFLVFKKLAKSVIFFAFWFT